MFCVCFVFVFYILHCTVYWSAVMCLCSDVLIGSKVQVQVFNFSVGLLFSLLAVFVFFGFCFFHFWVSC